MAETLKKILQIIAVFFTHVSFKKTIESPEAAVKSKKSGGMGAAKNYIGPLRPAGEYYFKEAILDQLELYFNVMQKIKKHDKHSYKLLYKRGVSLIPSSKYKSRDWAMIKPDEQLSPWFRKTLPTFGAIALDTPILREYCDKENTLFPRFMYFKKIKYREFGGVFEPFSGGSIYICSSYYDDDELSHGAPLIYPIHISDNGVIKLLKTKNSKDIIVTPRCGKKFTIPQTEIKHADFMFDDEKGLSSDGIVEKHYIEKFVLMANLFAESNSSMARIYCMKNNMRATFAIDILRTPYFFQDRDITITANNHRRKIFHIVRGHTRNLSNGKTTNVRTHFRGENKFNWNGYQISIHVPGWHSADFVEMNISGYDEIDLPKDVKRKELRGDGWLAKKLNKLEASGFGGEAVARGSATAPQKADSA